METRVQRSSAIAFGAAVLMIVVHLIQPDGPVGEASYLTVTGGAAVWAWCAVVRRPPGQRAAAAWLAFGIMCSALGDAIYSLLSAIRPIAPDISIADVFWVASYLGVAVGVIKMMAAGRQRRSRLDDDGLIDIAAAGVVCLMVVWHFWVGPTLDDSSTPWLVRCVSAAYPVLDAALLGLLVRTLLTYSISRPTRIALCGGMVAWFASDLGFLIAGYETSLRPWLDIGWMVGAVALASGTRASAAAPLIAQDDATVDGTAAGLEIWRIGFTLLPLFVPGLIELASVRSGKDPNPLSLLLATAIMLALAFSRTAILSAQAREKNRQLVTSKRLYERLAQNSSDAVLMMTEDGTLINDAPLLCRLLGFPETDTRGLNMIDRDRSVDGTSSARLIDRAVQLPNVVVDDEMQIRRPDGTTMWLGARAVNLLDDQAVGAVIVNLHDITMRKRAEAELEHQAFHDPLTGLANRALFRDRLEYALARRLRTGLDPVLLYIDLDGFKTINDSLGHEAGDDMLRAVAGRLALVVRTGDTIARLGGDEFAILVEPSAEPLAEARAIADRVLETLRSPVVLQAREIILSSSIGLAVATPEATPTSLLRDADVAMYQAKTRGKAQCVRYESSMHEAAIERLQISSDLNRAMVAEELHLVYQPVIDLQSEELAGFEALLRWDHPLLGAVPPDRFIPIAEENGLILPIGEWVLSTACRTIATWQQLYRRPDLSIAVNVSGRQLGSPTFIGEVQHALQSSGLDPSTLVLEMTETALIEDTNAVAARLTELRGLGVRLAVDDFGTGYSSLSYLRQFPIDILKVDRSFVQAITIDSHEAPAIIRGLLELAHTLGLEIVAEGIETETQLRHLRNEACEQGQGFYFSYPLDVHDAASLLRDARTPANSASPV